MEIKDTYSFLKPPIKEELRRSRCASGYDSIFEVAFTDLICRFAVVDGTVNAPAAVVYLSVMKALHPKGYARFDASDGITLLDGYFQRNSSSLLQPIQKPLLLVLAEKTGTSNGDTLSKLLYRAAEQVALSDGPLSILERSALDALQSTLGH